jgi:hypothetical protein
LNEDVSGIKTNSTLTPQQVQTIASRMIVMRRWLQLLLKTKRLEWGDRQNLLTLLKETERTASECIAALDNPIDRVLLKEIDGG